MERLESVLGGVRFGGADGKNAPHDVAPGTVEAALREHRPSAVQFFAPAVVGDNINQAQSMGARVMAQVGCERGGCKEWGGSGAGCTWQSTSPTASVPSICAAEPATILSIVAEP